MSLHRHLQHQIQCANQYRLVHLDSEYCVFLRCCFKYRMISLFSMLTLLVLKLECLDILQKKKPQQAIASVHLAPYALHQVPIQSMSCFSCLRPWYYVWLIEDDTVDTPRNLARGPRILSAGPAIPALPIGS